MAHEFVTIPSNAVKVRVAFDKIHGFWNTGRKVGEETVTIDWRNRSSFSHPFLFIKGNELVESLSKTSSLKTQKIDTLKKLKGFYWSNFRKIEYLVEVRPN
ncbi:hypothetical protein [Vibrio campbellii]|uniref:hypothetical protein n=1 Tax=Vibrio campbellii TaxID=680 RepID=UPI00210AC106|nr:hypothetical protein [Vibrio campbellii]